MKGHIMMFFVKFFSFFVVSTMSLCAMEVPGNDSSVSIVSNGCEFLRSVSPKTVVGIFGSTPRYSVFKRFCTTTLEAYDGYFNPKPRFVGRDEPPTIVPMSVQRVHEVFGRANAKKIAKVDCSNDVLKSLFQDCVRGSEDKNSHFDKLLHAFLYYAMDRRTMIQNVRVVIEQARAIGAKYLVHAFLPIYFNDVTLSLDTMQRFCAACATLYAGLYEEAGVPAGMQVVVVVPSFGCDDTSDAFYHHSCGRSVGSAVANDDVVRVLYDNVIACNQELTYAFINHNVDQNQELCDLFTKQHSNVEVLNIGLELSGNFNAYLEPSVYLHNERLCKDVLSICSVTK